MALDQSALLEVLDALKVADVGDRVRHAAETIYQALIEAELTEAIGAAPRGPAQPRVRGDRAFCYSPVTVGTTWPSRPMRLVRRLFPAVTLLLLVAVCASLVFGCGSSPAGVPIGGTPLAASSADHAGSHGEHAGCPAAPSGLTAPPVAMTKDAPQRTALAALAMFVGLVALAVVGSGTRLRRGAECVPWRTSGGCRTLLHHIAVLRI